MGVLKSRVTKVDVSSGEYVEIEKHFSIKVKNAESFFSVFINSIGRLYNLRTVSDYKVIISLCCNAQYNTGVIHLSAELRKSIMENTGLSTQSFSNSIYRLKTLGLIDGGRGSYTINPEIFWIGDRDARMKILKDGDFTIKFSVDGE